MKRNLDENFCRLVSFSSPFSPEIIIGWKRKRVDIQKLYYVPFLSYAIYYFVSSKLDF